MFVMNIALFICLLYLFVGRGYYVVSGFTSVEVVTIVLAALGVMLIALREAAGYGSFASHRSACVSGVAAG
jgi:hypothetical protein